MMGPYTINEMKQSGDIKLQPSNHKCREWVKTPIKDWIDHSILTKVIISVQRDNGA